jgi:hypothetical protein
MPSRTDNSQSLANFKKQTAEYFRQLHASGEKAGRADRDDTVVAIREGLADVQAGRVQGARQALQALAKQHGVSLPLN